MSLSVQVWFGVLVLLGYLGSPVGLAWGWLRFARMPRQRSLAAKLSVAGFLFATASGLLAFGSILYARGHTFRFNDPALMRIFRAGFLLSLAGIMFGIAGCWKSSSLRWHTPICGLTTAAFWFMAAVGE